MGARAGVGNGPRDSIRDPPTVVGRGSIASTSARTRRRKEHHDYRRGRAPGESAALLVEGLLSTGYPPERVAKFSEERDAVGHAISLMSPGSIAVIVADSPAVLKQFDAYVTRT